MTPTLEESLRSLVLSPALPQIRQQYVLMTQNYRRFLAKQAPSYQPDKRTAELLVDTFRYLYRELLPHPRFQQAYGAPVGLTQPLRQAYIEAIQQQITVCPYCDTADISYDPGLELDHFLAISAFPLLGIHGPNLVPGCTTCNGLRVKGSTFIGTRGGRSENSPIAHPFWDEVDQVAQIYMDRAFSNVSFRFRPGTSKLDRTKAWNFLRVFDLRSKYRALGFRRRLRDYVVKVRKLVVQQYRADQGSSWMDLAVAFRTAIAKERSEQQSCKRDHFLTKAKLDLLDQMETTHQATHLRYLAGELRLP